MDELIEQNMGLVISIVNSFKPKNHTERQDLVDAGRIGLWKALQKYNLKSGNLLSTYAWRPIKWSIIREIRNVKSSGNISIEDLTHDPEVNNHDKIWEYYHSNITEEEIQLIDLRNQGYKFREICEKLNQSPSVVKNKIYKLINKIREINEQ